MEGCKEVQNYDLERVNCPLCQSIKSSIFIENSKELYNDIDEYFNVERCEECGHYFTNPRPTKETIGYFYPDSAGYYHPTIQEQKSGFSYEIYKGILHHYFDYRLDTKANFLLSSLGYFFKKRHLATSHIPKYITNGKLLDIGSSYGGYLMKMKNLGWNVYGTEINAKAAQFANTSLGVNTIENLFFEENTFEKDFFNVVNMNMVLEHVYEPVSIIKDVARILKYNGQLTLSVPDISGFEAKVYKQYAYGLQVPEHLQHFTPKTITTLLEQHGFKVEKIIHQNFDRDLVASSGYMKNKLLSRILQNKYFRQSFVKIFVWFLATIGKSSRMSVYARKIS